MFFRPEILFAVYPLVSLITIFNSMYVCVSFHHTHTYVYMHSSIKRQNCQLIY